MANDFFIPDRFLEKRIFSGDCWLWNGAKDPSGYGAVKYYGRKRNLHRVIAHIVYGSDLDGNHIEICHKLECPNRECWNPDHLYVGTRSSNMHDALKRGTHGRFGRKRFTVFND